LKIENSAKSLLVTGFKPFHGHEHNSSQILGQALADHVGCEFLVLPVSYQKAWDELRAKLDAGSFSHVLMLGQGGGRTKIGIEKVAVNLEDCEKEDQSGEVRLENPVDHEGPSAILNPTPLRGIVNELKSYFGPVELSSSCGTFVCNSTYYKALQWAQSAVSRPGNPEAKVLFVHLPYLPEQVMGRCSVSPFLVQALQLEILRSLAQKWLAL
jgi:pyroglutamyl-peptidase